MRLSEYIQPLGISPDLKAQDKAQVLSELASLISQRHPSLKAEEIATALLNREALGSTGVADGVAIPHAKLKNLERVIITCGRSLTGIEFDAPDQKPTHLFFVLLAPEKSAAIHLKILARLSRLLKDEPFRNKLMEAKTREDIYKIITHGDSR